MLVLLTIATAVLTGLMFRHASEGAKSHAALKRAETAAERAAFYRQRLLSSFWTFGVGSICLLAVAGQLDALRGMPSAFAPLQLAAREQSWIGLLSLSDLPHVAFPVLIGVSLVSLLTVLRPSAKPIAIGDIAVLVPRTWPEIGWGALLSLNAGLSEEICFRVVLPLALTLISGSPWIGFGLAVLLFGMLHLYQGPVGIIFTMLIGGVFAVQYLASGSLALVIVLHAGFNAMTLVFRPTIILVLTAFKKQILLLAPHVR